MKKTLLLISSTPELAAFAESVARSCGLEFVQRPIPAAGTAPSADETPALLFAEVPGPEAGQWLERAYGGRISRNRVHFLTSKEQLAHFNPASQGKLAGSVITFRAGADLSPLSERYGQICLSALRRSLGSSTSFFPADAQVQSLVLNESLQKGLAAQALADHLEERKVQSRISLMIANALDELLMNAIFDAPADNEGNSIYGNMPRKVNLPLKGAGSIHLSLITHGDRIGISVSDLFGSLDRDVVIGHYLKGLAPEPETRIDESRPGAGLGLALVCRSGGSLFIFCEPGKRTEITAFFDVTPKVRDFQAQPRFISTYISE